MSFANFLHQTVNNPASEEDDLLEVHEEITALSPDDRRERARAILKAFPALEEFQAKLSNETTGILIQHFGSVAMYYAMVLNQFSKNAGMVM